MWFDISMLFCVVLLSQSQAYAQEEGGELNSDSVVSKIHDGNGPCACQPSSWTFELDFSLTSCALLREYDNVSSTSFGRGIRQQTCLEPETPKPSSNNETTKFSQVNVIQVLELNQNHNVIFQEVFPGPFHNRDELQYISPLLSTKSSENETIHPEEAPPDAQSFLVPLTIVVVLKGENDMQQEITASWSLQFSNDCQAAAYPLVRGNEETILTRVIHVEPPSREFCPSAPAIFEDTPSPSRAPLPTFSPSLTPFSLMPTDVIQDMFLPVCACQPQTWRFQVCLHCSCLDDTPAGVVQESCIIEKNQNEGDHLSLNFTSMTHVTDVTILELNENLETLSQQVLPGVFVDGDEFVYNSSLLQQEPPDQEDLYNVDRIPRGIAVIYQGPNAQGDLLKASWSWIFGGLDHSGCQPIDPNAIMSQTTVNTLVKSVSGPSPSWCLSSTPLPSLLPTCAPVQKQQLPHILTGKRKIPRPRPGKKSKKKKRKKKSKKKKREKKTRTGKRNGRLRRATQKGGDQNQGENWVQTKSRLPSSSDVLCSSSFQENETVTRHKTGRWSGSSSASF